MGGPPWLPAADIRAVMAIELRALLAPETGASPELCRYLADRLNDQLTAAVPRGGIGCSREIIPLCHAFQTLVGWVRYSKTVLRSRRPPRWPAAVWPPTNLVPRRASRSAHR